MTSKEIKEKGFYWIRSSKEPPRIEYIRRFQNQWCISNWEISDDAEYHGPIAKPPGW